MDTSKMFTIPALIDAANRELLRLDYSQSAADRYNKHFREFAEYCDQKMLQYYEPETGPMYFWHCYGLDIADRELSLDRHQKEKRCAIRFLDDVYQFGFARRHSSHDYSKPTDNTALMEDYLTYCKINKGADGTIQVKRTKLKQFLRFLAARKISLRNVTPADLSDYMITLSGYSRSSIQVTVSTLKCFFRYLNEEGVILTDLSPSIPKPKIYAEETIPETWTPEEVRRLLAAVDRSSGVGKRDYAMILLAVVLGMRAGDICALRFRDLDWNRKLITYTQQKTHKVNTLPILPEIGEAIIDYLQNGRLISESDTVFIRHIHPYGPFQSSSVLSLNIKRYMRYAGIQIKERKAAHALRHTLASSLLYSGTPLMTISNILGHYNPKTTVGYTKIDLSALRKCSLSYGKKEAGECAR